MQDFYSHNNILLQIKKQTEKVLFFSIKQGFKLM